MRTRGISGNAAQAPTSHEEPITLFYVHLQVRSIKGYSWAVYRDMPCMRKTALVSHAQEHGYFDWECSAW